MLGCMYTVLNFCSTGLSRWYSVCTLLKVDIMAKRLRQVRNDWSASSRGRAGDEFWEWEFDVSGSGQQLANTVIGARA